MVSERRVWAHASDRAQTMPQRGPSLHLLFYPPAISGFKKVLLKNDASRSNYFQTLSLKQTAK